jgi:dolichol-phosphate mannosyltransferase
MAEVTVEIAARSRFDAAHGASRLRIRSLLSRWPRLAAMAGGAVSMRTATRFAVVVAIGVCANIAVSHALIALGSDALAAQISSLLGAMIVSYALNSRWTFSDYSARSLETEWHIFGRFFAISLMAVFLYAGIHQLASDVWKWAQAGVVLGI